MRRTSVLALAVLLLAFTSTQVLTRNDINSGIGTTYAWSGAAQSWSGSTQNLTCSDWTTYVRNDGTACTPSTLNVTYGYASAHAVVTVTHSPLVANNTFSGGSFSSWSSANTSACTGAVFTGQNTTDEDGDLGLAGASSLSCNSTSAVVTLTQSFSISGTPTSQTYSLWYKAPATTAGSNLCSPTAGTAPFTIKIGATVVASITPVYDGNWHQASGSLTALASGSNTLTITATLTAASGQNYNAKFSSCISGNVYTAQPLYLDNISFSAVW